MSKDYPDRAVWLAKRTKSYSLRKTASLRERYVHVSVNVWKVERLIGTEEDLNRQGTGVFDYHRTPRGEGITYRKPKDE